MSKRCATFFLLIGLLLVGLPGAGAQDGLNLPAELYVLTNSGIVQRYGVGASGIAAITPEDVFVIDFGLSPDSSQIAYRTEGGLTIAPVAGGDGRIVDGVSAGIPPVRGRGATIAWSPDGGALAYTTPYGGRVFFDTEPPTFATLQEGAFRQVLWSPDGAYLAAEAEGGIWWLYRREAGTLRLTSAIPSSVGLTWLSASAVAFAPAEGGLYRMDLADANRQTLLLDATWVYGLPYRAPDGTLLVFGRQLADEAIPEGYGRLIALAPDATEVTSQSETAIEYQDLQWAPGGALMVLFRGGVLALVTPQDGQGLALPVADTVAFDWGPLLTREAEAAEQP